MNIAHLIEPHHMILSIFGNVNANYEMDERSAGTEKKRFKELMDVLSEIISDSDIEYANYEWADISIDGDGIEITINFGEEPEDEEDEDEDYGNIYFRFDRFGNYIDLEKESA